MIKIYCDLDLKFQGAMGSDLCLISLTNVMQKLYCPSSHLFILLHMVFFFFSYCSPPFFFLLQQHQILDNESDFLLVDHNFMDKLDSVSNCKLHGQT
jgi:hypothetical protein